MNRIESRAENFAKMRDAETALLATGFSKEQWLHMKTFFAYATAEAFGVTESARNGNDPVTGEPKDLPTVMKPGEFQTRVAD